jgi:DNA-binding MarR family transcriptional regulator
MSRGTLRDTYLKPLEQKGLIDIEDDPKDKRRKTIALKGTIQEESLINDEQFRKRIAGKVG